MTKTAPGMVPCRPCTTALRSIRANRGVARKVAVGSVVLVTISRAQQEAERQTVIAEKQSAIAAKETDKAKGAEQRVLDQLNQLKAEEAARIKAEASAATAGKAVESSQAALAAKAIELQAALEESVKNAAAAQAMARQANAAEKKERVARQEQEAQAKKLAGLVRKQNQRLKKLERERSKIVTDLK